jgi:hypothetical protein
MATVIGYHRSTARRMSDATSNKVPDLRHGQQVGPFFFR